MDTHQLRADDTFIVLIDLQEGIVNVAVTADQRRLRTCVGALVELATIFSIPFALSCVPTTGGTIAPSLAEITRQHADAPQYVRTTANALNDNALRTALESSGRRTLVLAGIATEVAVMQAALSARRLGYSVIVAVDACSGLDARSESATITHMSASGVILSSVPALAAELGDDFGSEHGRAAMGTLQSIIGAHAHTHTQDEAGSGYAEHEHGHAEHEHGHAEHGHEHGHDREPEHGHDREHGHAQQR